MPRQIDLDEVASRVAAVRHRVRELTDRPVALVAVTKSFDVDAVVAAAGAGCDAIGENYAQELLAKAPDLPPGMPVHFIGRLQSNKVRSLVGLVDVWETVDRPSLAGEIGRRSGVAPARVLLQVNTTGEHSKGGCEPQALRSLLEASVAAGLTVDGLMTIGPTGASVEVCREAFRTLRRLADEHGLVHCSMGMSDDWETAVEEGSTIIRLGSALFGSRT
jgi:hypothetical protein